MTQENVEQVVTHADKLERVRLGRKGGHPIMVEWLDAGDLRNEVVYVCKVGRETEEIVMATEIVETTFDKILRVNGAPTTYGDTYYKLVDYLDGKKGEVIRVKYTKKENRRGKELHGYSAWCERSQVFVDTG